MHSRNEDSQGRTVSSRRRGGLATRGRSGRHDAMPRVLFLLLLASLLSCRAESPNPASPKADKPDTGGGTGTTRYDASTDPLVNPPQAFEKAPEDLERIALDETIVRRLRGEPTTLNPLFWAQDRPTAQVYGQIFQSLIRIDAEFVWQHEPDLVEKVEIDAKGLDYTFTIRPDAVFHDGEPVTGDDVLFSWECFGSDAIKSRVFSGRRRDIVDVEVLEDDLRKVRLTLASKIPVLRWQLAFPILPRHIYGKPEEIAADPTLSKSPYYRRLTREPVGSGPFRFSSWKMGQSITLERFESFAGKKPYCQRLVFRVVGDEGQALRMFKAGELDELELRPLQFATQTSDASFAQVGRKIFDSQWSYFFIYWNLVRPGSHTESSSETEAGAPKPQQSIEKHPILGDRHVRVALAHAIDMPGVLDRIGYNLYQRASGVFHPKSWMHDPDIQLLEFDLERAGELLDEAGWRIDADDGWRYRTIDGKKTPLRLSVLANASSQIGLDSAAVFQSMFKRVGVELRIERLEFKTILSRKNTRDFDAILLGHGAGTDPDLLRPLYHSSEFPAGRNSNGYSNPEVDRHFDLGRATTDREERARHYRALSRLIYEDQPCLFLWYVPTLHAVHKRFRGIQTSPRGLFRFQPSLRAWWVPKEEKLR